MLISVNDMDDDKSNDPFLLAQRVTALEVKVGGIESDIHEIKTDLKEVKKTLNKWLWFGFSTAIGVLLNIILWIMFAL